MSKNINMPKLRFREFSGEWEDKIFGEIATNKSKKHNPQKDKNSYKCIELEHLSSENGLLLGYIDSLNSESIKNMFNKNDVLFGKLRPYLKKYLLAPFDGVCSSEIWVLNGIEVSNSFLYYIVQGEYFINLANQSSGSKMPRADWDNISNSIFFIPQKEEQEKIAIFLTSIDEKIEKLTKKDKLLQEYKKSIMQKIFSQEIRFKDDNGDEFSKWENKRLEDVLSTVSTKLYQIKSTDILEKGTYKVIDQGQNKVAGYCNDDNKVYRNGEIIVYGDHTTIVKYIDFDFIVGADGTKLLTTIKSNNLKYMYYNLLYNNIQAEGYKRHFSILRTVILQIPCIEEQNKISNFLSSIDDKIEENQKILEKAKEFKKSLLQQMFI